MMRNIFNIILLLQVSITFSQGNMLGLQKAIQIIKSGEYEINESIEYDLDTIGTQIIRQLFYDKANYPDRVSKEKYLERYRSSRKEYLERDEFSKWETEVISRAYKKRRNDKEYRKRVYTLTDEDSLLIYGSKKSFNNHKVKIKGDQPLWSLSLFDTSMIENPYYIFFKFRIQSIDGKHNYDIWPKTVANKITQNGEFIGRGSVFIYNFKFLVGIPKVNLKNKNNERLELPLLLLSEDFIFYPTSNQLLTTILDVSGYSDSASLTSLVKLYTCFKYGASRVQQFQALRCRKLNLFSRKEYYRFSILNRKSQNSNFKDTTEYIATINKSYDIKYKLVEEPKNLIPFVRKTCKEFYEQYDINNKTLKINFISKRGRKFIYEAEWSRQGVRYLNSSESYEYLGAKVTYKRGKVFCSKKIKIK